MKQRNLTLSLDDGLLDLARRYARKRNISLNALVRSLLEQAVGRSSDPEWIGDFFAVCDELQGDSGGKGWSREELHER